MGCWYGVHGEMRVKDTKKTRELVEALEEDCGEIEVAVENHDDKTFTLEVSGGQGCSYSIACLIDDHLRAFGPYVVGEAACFYTECDGEDGEVWVGKPAAVKKGQRKALVDEARKAIRKLTPKEWEALAQEATSPHFWIDSNSPDDDEEDDDE
jgi:hypothetical protein